MTAQEAQTNRSMLSPLGTFWETGLPQALQKFMASTPTEAGM
jgi:hypothetical protein